jgi:ElaB/YqjD/DUF883 family membrane-anchored ribosome-binding protein
MFTTSKEDGITNLKDSVHDINGELHNAANQAGRKVRSLYNSASDEITHASDTVTSEIRSNPVRSSLIAMGVGVLLGALLRR